MKKNSTIVLAIALAMLAAVIILAITQNGIERTAGTDAATEPKTTTTTGPTKADSSTEPAPIVAPTPALSGSVDLDEACSVRLQLTNNGDTDIVAEVQISTADDVVLEESVVPAWSQLTITLVRASPIEGVIMLSATGSNEPAVNWQADYSACPNGPAVTPPTGGVGDAQQLERLPGAPATATADSA